MGSRLIIFFFIVGLRGFCGTLSSPGLVFARLCLALSKSYTPASGRVAIRGMQLFEKLFPFALCGAFGGSVMIGTLRTSRGLMRNFSICSSLHFFTWTAGWLAPRVISFSDFLFLSFVSPSPSPLCILSVYQGLRPSALLIYSIDFQKKKKKMWWFSLNMAN